MCKIFVLMLSLLLSACSLTPAESTLLNQQNRVSHGREFKPRQENPGARIDWERARRLPEGAQNFDPAWLAQAKNAIRAMPKLRAKRAQEWRWLGPNQLGGRTRAIAVSPKPPYTIWVGAASGGIFVSHDEGKRFQFSGEGLAHLSVGAIALHADGKGILVGTGELYRNTVHPYSAMAGGGVFESLDGGKHFSPWSASQNADFAYVSDVVISPRNPKRIYIASNSGVWRTNDGGKTLQRLLWPSIDQLAKYEGCTDLDLRLYEGKEQLLASCSSRSIDDRYYLPGTLGGACQGPCPSALFRTEDASASTVHFDMVLSEAGMGRSSIARAPSDPDRLYLLSASILPGPDRDNDLNGDYDNGLHALFHSEDGGVSWQARLRNTSDELLSTFLLHSLTGTYNSTCRFFTGGNDYYAAGWYDQTIAVDPKSADTVWVGGIDLFRSDDGGRSFGIASYGWAQRGTPGAMHVDQHVLAFHPEYDRVQNRTLFIGNDGGFYKTLDTLKPTNRGERAACEVSPSTPSFQSAAEGLGSSQFYHGSVSSDGKRILAGAQDNGTWMQHPSEPATGPARSESLFGGDGSYSAIDPRDPNTLYLSSQFGNVYRVSIETPVGQGGSAGPQAFYRRIGQGVTEQGLFITPFVLDAANPDRLWLGTSRVWRSANKGTSWERASASFGADFGDQINALASHRARPGTLIVGTGRGIYRHGDAYSSTQNTVWQQTQPRTGWVSSLAFDPSDPQTVYATYSTFGGQHVWRSRDGGISFSAIDNNLPNLPVHSIAVHPSDSKRLYIGTDLGLFVSRNGGDSWSAEESGFGAAIVESLVINTRAPHTLHAFTYGRGIWSIPLEQIDAQSVDRADPQYTAHWWNPAQSGQGVHMEVLNQNDQAQLLLSWYTYKNGKPHWLYGVGPLRNQRASVPLVSLSGADFPPLFQSSQVQQTAFGTVEIEFQTPQLAHLSYPGGVLELQPLTRPSFTAPRASAQLSECHSGNWYQPENSGHGLSVLVHPGGGGVETIITWYVYLKGEAFYLVGNGPIENGVAKMGAYRTEGAQFGPLFQTDQVRVTRVGEMRLQAIDANRTRFEWDLDPVAMNFDPASAQQQRSGNLIMTRLTNVAGLNCEF